MPTFFDTHAHYFDPKFDTLDGGVEALLASSEFCATVCGVINAGTSPENSHTAVEQAARYPFMYAAVGIHPEDCQTKALDVVEDIARIRAMLADPAARCRDKIVAIGEIGLDYYWEPIDKPKQMAFFRAQLDMAEEFDLPVLIHDREAHGDCFDVVRAYPGVRGVFHGYSGSVEMAKELVKRGWYIAFGGVVTFKNAHRVREVAASIPLDHLLIETDCPYMAPVPHRGKVCHSAMLPHVAEMLAELHHTTVDEIAAVTTENAKRLFAL